MESYGELQKLLHEGNIYDRDPASLHTKAVYLIAFLIAIK